MKSEKGLTLIEIIITMAIIAIIAVAVLSIFSTTFIQIVRAGNFTDATFKTQGEVEKLLTIKLPLNYTYTNPGMILTFPDGNSNGFKDTLGAGRINSAGDKRTLDTTVQGKKSTIVIFHPTY
jgi:prepilin-type N-terminal cleavage/methylation domain-containing protein